MTFFISRSMFYLCWIPCPLCLLDQFAVIRVSVFGGLVFFAGLCCVGVFPFKAMVNQIRSSLATGFPLPCHDALISRFSFLCPGLGFFDLRLPLRRGSTVVRLQDPRRAFVDLAMGRAPRFFPPTPLSEDGQLESARRGSFLFGFIRSA